MASPQQKSQRMRGLSFRAEYAGASRAPGGGAQNKSSSPLTNLKKALAGGKGREQEQTRRRAPSMLHEPSRHMIPPKRKDDRTKVTVVLDLDETLIYAREGPLFCRPHLTELFELLGDKCETIVWTAGIRPYAQAVIKNIDKEGVVQHCIYRHSKWFSGEPGYAKDLGLVGRDLNKTLIIENTPDCVRGYEQNGILVPDYEGGEQPDATLLIVRQLISECCESHMTVPEFISQTPLLQKQWVPTEHGDNLLCYCVDASAFQYDRPKLNRDAPKR
eukprot:NODE_1443_length_1416_cov_20.761522_g1200_i0.p1 GENE.NODE_1443_length_1416_cov_20.761522_g1200_i0~~NODE_1443_length_1416_cov_20.761522_g1200_i0.p1  ORF type:complete len:274 (-),score=34.11 NODE_1443_length_1416_cov_20.761522_g1200_i0:328-1149(-)